MPSSRPSAVASCPAARGARGELAADQPVAEDDDLHEVRPCRWATPQWMRLGSTPVAAGSWDGRQPSAPAERRKPSILVGFTCHCSCVMRAVGRLDGQQGPGVRRRPRSAARRDRSPRPTRCGCRARSAAGRRRRRRRARASADDRDAGDPTDAVAVGEADDVVGQQPLERDDVAGPGRRGRTPRAAGGAPSAGDRLAALGHEVLAGAADELAGVRGLSPGSRRSRRRGSRTTPAARRRPAPSGSAARAAAGAPVSTSWPVPAPSVGSALVSTGSGSQGPTYDSRRARADWATFRREPGRGGGEEGGRVRDHACGRCPASAATPPGRRPRPRSSCRAAGRRSPNSRGRTPPKISAASTRASLAGSGRPSMLGRGRALRSGAPGWSRPSST